MRILSRTSGTSARLGTLLLLLPLLAGCEGDATGLAERRVGPEGGVVSLEGGAVRISIPAGALSEEIWFTAMPTASVPGSELLVNGSSYEVGPFGTGLAVPVTLTISYDPANLPDGIGEDGLGIHRVAGSDWELTGRPTVDAGAHAVSGQVSSLGRFGVLAIPVASVEVAPGSSALEPGKTVQLTATPKAGNGLALGSRQTVWTSSDQTVATVTASGLVAGVGEGATTVTATSGGQSGTATVTVTVPVASVAVSPGSGAMKVGEKLQLTATPRDAAGNDLTGRTVTWSSSEPSAATVDARGLVTAVAMGSTAITAEVEGKKGSAAVAVHGPLSVATGYLAGGVVGAPYNQALAATGGDGTYAWSVSGGTLPTGLTLGPATGLITGSPAAAGVSSFSVRVESAGQTATKALSIRIDLVPVTSVVVAPPSANLTRGDTLRLTATARDASGNVLTGRPVTWQSSNVLVATVTGSGLVTGLAQGPATITATVGGFPGWASITVNGVLSVADTALATGVVGVAYRDTLDAFGGDGSYGWTITAGALPAGLSLNESIGVISGTPSAAGPSTFTVEATSGDGQTATRALSLVVYPVLDVSTASLAGGVVGTPYNQVLAATGGAGPYRWSLVGGALPTGLALNTISGVITGTPTVEGTAAFTVEAESADGQTATKPLTILVSPVPVASVEVLPAAVTTTPGGTAQLTATPRDASANVLSGRTVSWASSDEGVATVDAAGLVTSVGVGFAMITATVEGKSDTATCTVYAVLSLLTASLADGTVGAAYNQTLAATGGNGTYTWSLSAGTLPAGLSLATGTGSISGNPTGAGTYTFTVQVMSGDGQTATKELSITVG